MLEKEIYSYRFVDIKNRILLWKILIENFFQKLFDTNDIVLDLACGYGEFINQIKCKQKYAVDLNPDARKYLSNDVAFIHSTADKTALNNGSVGKVFISNFFEHLSREEIVRVIKEIHRVLKPKGKVIILQPNIRFCAKDYWMFFDHITPIDDRGLTEIFTVENFKLTQLILKFLPYTTKGNLPINAFLIKTYLKLPIVWRFFGKQSLLIFEKQMNEKR